MPAHTPPHKAGAGADIATPAQRLQMCELAAAGVEGVRACDLEVRRGGPSYTIDTLQEIHDANPDAALTLIVGADMALTLGSWRRPDRLLELADLAVATRSGASREQVLDALRPLGTQPARVRFLKMPPIEVSSSAVREHVAAGDSPAETLPAEVARYVVDHRLYEAVAK
jgi:nicotinate-nucleotide adenylyltransferase